MKVLLVSLPDQSPMCRTMLWRKLEQALATVHRATPAALGRGADAGAAVVRVDGRRSQGLRAHIHDEESANCGPWGMAVGGPVVEADGPRVVDRHLPVVGGVRGEVGEAHRVAAVRVRNETQGFIGVPVVLSHGDADRRRFLLPVIDELLHRN